MDIAAESYVKLALAVGQHDPDFVDAYYGPVTWKLEAESAPIGLPEIEQRATALATELGNGPDTDAPEIVRLRHAYLTRQLAAMIARVKMLHGANLSFDDEARALYDVTPPANTEDHFRDLVARLEDELPGSGPVPARYVAYRNRFIVLAERVDAVFQAAIAAGRERTSRYIALPPDERDRRGTR